MKQTVLKIHPDDSVLVADLEPGCSPLSKLTVGLECGWSDGFSGISANPVVGHASDLVVALGGTVILAEFSELCGVEQELCDRCTDTEPGLNLLCTPGNDVESTTAEVSSPWAVNCLTTGRSRSMPTTLRNLPVGPFSTRFVRVSRSVDRRFFSLNRPCW